MNLLNITFLSLVDYSFTKKCWWQRHVYVIPVDFQAVDFPTSQYQVGIGKYERVEICSQSVTCKGQRYTVQEFQC